MKKVEINKSVLDKMFMYAKYAHKHFDAEIAGWAHYRPSKGIYKIAPLQKQVVSRAEVEALPPASGNISDMVVQWHSHADMKTFFSATDETNIKKCLELYPFLISIVVNIYGEYSARLDVARYKYLDEVMEVGQFTSELKLDVVYEDKKVEEEVLSKCEQPKRIAELSNWDWDYGIEYTNFIKPNDVINNRLYEKIDWLVQELENNGLTCITSYSLKYVYVNGIKIYVNNNGYYINNQFITINTIGDVKKFVKEHIF